MGEEERATRTSAGEDGRRKCGVARRGRGSEGEDGTFCSLFLLLSWRKWGLLALIRGEKLVRGVSGRVDAVHADLDELLVRGGLVCDREELDVGVVAVVLGAFHPVAVVEQGVGVAH